MSKVYLGCVSGGQVFIFVAGSFFGFADRVRYAS